METAEVTPIPAPQPESQITIVPHKSIFDKAVCLSISRNFPKLSKALPKERIQTTGDKSKFHGSKDLYNSVHLKKLVNLEIALDATIKRYASAPFPLKTGVYILARDLYNTVEAAIAKHIAEREVLINDFCNDYDAEVAKAKEFQGDAFDPSDYSTGANVKKHFKFSWHYLTMDVAENLGQVSKDALQRENEKMEAVWQDVRESSKAILRVQVAGMVNRLVERLTPAEEGKRKILRSNALDPLNEFIATFNSRDLTGDLELQSLVHKMQQLVNGVSPQMLKDAEGLKATTLQGFTEVKAVLDTMVVDAADRDIDLGEPEVEEVAVIQ